MVQKGACTMKKRRSGTNQRTVRKLTFLIEIDEIKALHLRNGIFAFYRKGELIHAFEPFNVKQPDALSKRSYHFDQHDILLMNERFPQQIPLYDEAMTLRSWANQVEYGLYQLIDTGRLSFIHEDDTGYKMEATIQWTGETLAVPTPVYKKGKDPK
ncbi:hypothetical protein BLD48_08500 [Exiguobacterium sp. KRL4]|nr:hypothetical protein BLD48_08500 [Exiguobacterium sp. KRL4]